MKRKIINPLFRDTCTFLRTSDETNGKYSEMEVELDAHGGNPMHVHNAFNETFTAVDGDLGLTVDGKNITLEPGESYTVRKGQSHRFFNPGNRIIRYKVTFVPGNPGMENMLRILYGLAGDGRTNSKGIPKSLTTIGILQEMSDTRLTGFMRLLTPLLLWLAARARKQGLDKLLIERYCTNKIQTQVIL